MFGKLIERGRRGAEARAAGRRDALAARLAEAVPRGVEVTRESEAVVLSGRGLGLRFASEAELRWLVAEMRDDR